MNQLFAHIEIMPNYMYHMTLNPEYCVSAFQGYIYSDQKTDSQKVKICL